MAFDVADLIASTVRLSVPLTFAGLGGLLCERVGIVNIGLEGTMLGGAFFGVLGSYLTGSAWVGLAFAALAGSMLAGIHAVMTIRFGVNQIIAGIAINLLGAGGTSYLLAQIYGHPGSTPQVKGFGATQIPLLHDIPLIGTAFFGQSWFVIAAPVTVVAVWWFLSRTTIGLRLRASGEDPTALEVAGVSVLPLRYAAVTLSGLLCGVGGAYLSLSLLNEFSENMTAGRGYIALAAVIFGGWRPLRVYLATLFFGLAGALVIRLPQHAIDPNLLNMLPYVVTILALVLFGRGMFAPAAVGRPYRPGSGRT